VTTIEGIAALVIAALVSPSAGAALRASAVQGFDQCANSSGGAGYAGKCEWVSGVLNANNSAYAEGDSVPLRIHLAGFAPGSTHSVSFTWTARVGSVNAYDFLATYDASEGWITPSDPCRGIAGCDGATTSTFPIPHDPAVPPNYEDAVAPRVWTARGATLTAASVPAPVVLAGGAGLDKSTTVTFRVDTSGSMCASSCSVVLLVGAHVASELDWGIGLGASNLQGAALEIDLTAVDGASVGGSSLKLQGNAVLPPRPGITLIKSADVASYSRAGEEILYIYTVRNTGPALVSYSVSDPLPGLSPVNCPSIVLVARADAICSATYVTTQADVDRGSIQNHATAHAVAAGGQSLTASATLTIPASPVTSLVIVKSASPSSFASVGEVISYSYVVTNTGTVTVHSVSVADGHAGLSPVSCRGTTLAPGASLTCSATYRVTQGDLDAGSITNTATAHAVTASGRSISSAPATATVTAVVSPSLDLTKSASPTTVSVAGEVVTYAFHPTNTGNVTLHALSVTDALAGTSPVSCAATSLAVGASTTCTATRPVTQGDLDAGEVINSATASARAPHGQLARSPVATATVTALRAPALALVKSSVESSFHAPGELLTYRFEATNTGNVTLSALDIVDSSGSLSTIDCPSTTLAPGQSTTCSAAYVTTQGDLDAGFVTDTATASATTPTGSQVSSNPSSATVPAATAPSLSLIKSVAPASYDAPGTTLTFSFAVANNGNVTVGALEVNDGLAGLSSPTCAATSLAPGAGTLCTATYVTTQGDLDTGEVANSASAVGLTGSGSSVASNPASAIAPADVAPALSLEKSATPTSVSAAGQTITYSFLATNTGNVTVHGLGVLDAHVGLSAISCPTTTLAPGATTTCSATYVVTQADIDAGEIADSAHADAATPAGAAVASPVSSVVVPASGTPGLRLRKSAAPLLVSSAGTVVTFTFTATNTGQATLDSLAITDPLVGASAPTCDATTLAPGASATCAATYAVTQGDLDAGGLTNTATAHALAPGGAPVDSPPASARVVAIPEPALALTKSAVPSTYSAPGATITFSFHLVNSGNLTLHSPNVVDALDGLSPPACAPGPLAPGAATTCTATYVVTQGDLDAGEVANDALGAASAPDGASVLSAPARATATALVAPGLALAKSVAPDHYSRAGDVLTFSFAASNVGNVTLGALGVTDTLPGLGQVHCPVTVMAPGASTTCAATYLSTQGDLDAGSVTNGAVAHASDPQGAHVLSGPASATADAVQVATLSLAKSASPSVLAAVGQSVTFTLDVANTGNVTVQNIAVLEHLAGTSAPQCPSATLAPGAAMACTSTYVVTQGDLDAGSLTNDASVTGTGPLGQPAGASAEVTVPALVAPALRLDKSVVPSSYAAVGDVLTFSFAVNNDGNVTLSSLAVSDQLAGLSAVACPSASLAPGESATCTATYAVTQHDLDVGVVANTGRASATAPSGSPVFSLVARAAAFAEEQPALTLEKSASHAVVLLAGTTITYTMVVANTGNVTLNDVGVIEELPGASVPECPRRVLAPGESMTCTASYVVTQADVDQGSLVNRAVAVSGTAAGTAVTSPVSSVTVLSPHLAKLEMTKSSLEGTYTKAGDVVHYRFRVVNRGNVTLSAIVISDALLAGAHVPVSCPDVWLIPFRGETCSADYVVTAADVARGHITNTAVASAATPTGVRTRSAASSATVHLVEAPSISLVLSSDTAFFTRAGQRVQFRFTVTNTGNVALSHVAVGADLAGLGPVSCPSAHLAPGASMTCHASYATSAADVAGGSIRLRAVVEGLSPHGRLVRNGAGLAVPLRAPATAVTG
jgi:uncharacterized repeat protein (TIGR01451 family)